MFTICVLVVVLVVLVHAMVNTKLRYFSQSRHSIDQVCRPYFGCFVKVCHAIVKSWGQKKSLNPESSAMGIVVIVGIIGIYHPLPWP